MKIKLDENLGLLGKSLLEADGHDVMTVADQQMSGATDEHIYGVCKAEGRVLARSTTISVRPFVFRPKSCPVSSFSSAKDVHHRRRYRHGWSAVVPHLE